MTQSKHSLAAFVPSAPIFILASASPDQLSLQEKSSDIVLSIQSTSLWQVSHKLARYINSVPGSNLAWVAASSTTNRLPYIHCCDNNLVVVSSNRPNEHQFFL